MKDIQKSVDFTLNATLAATPRSKAFHFLLIFVSFTSILSDFLISVRMLK